MTVKQVDVKLNCVLLVVKISLIPGFNPGPFTGSGNNTYLIGGSEPTLIDAATGAEAHLQELKSSLGRGLLSRVLITHGHNDHISGVTEISKCLFSPTSSGSESFV